MPSEIAKLVKEFRQEIRDLRGAMEKELRKEFKEIKSSMDMFNTQFEAVIARCSKIEKDNVALKKENATLLAECRSLKELVCDSEQRLTEIEQYSRNKNLEVKGIPVVENENLLGLLSKIGDVIEEPMTPSDIDVCHRVTGKNEGCPNIVVQFRHRAKRNAVFDKARKKRLDTSHLLLPGHNMVFINEHLCPTLKKLLGQTVARKKEVKWKYAWTKDGKIFARKTDTSRVLRIACVSDIDKIA